MTRPTVDFGVLSPYPTVVMVTIAQYSPSRSVMTEDSEPCAEG